MQISLPVLTLLMRHNLSPHYAALVLPITVLQSVKFLTHRVSLTLMMHNHDDTLFRKHFSFRPIWVQEYVNHSLYQELVYHFSYPFGYKRYRLDNRCDSYATNSEINSVARKYLFENEYMFSSLILLSTLE